MSEERMTPPTELPIICMDASLMVFPGVRTHFADQRKEDITSMMKKFGITTECPWAILVMLNPKINKFPDNLYKKGVVSEVKIDIETGEIVFIGLCRAEILSVKSVLRNDDKEGNMPPPYLAEIKYLVDQNCDEYFLNSETAIRGAFLILKKLFLSYFKEIHEICDISNLAYNISSINKLDFQDKDAVDQLIWAILYQMPDHVGSDERQVFLESDSLIERLELLGKLIDKHLRIASFANDNAQSLSRRSRSIVLTGGSKKPQETADKPDKNDGDDEFVNGAHEDIKKAWEKFKTVRDFMNESAKAKVLEELNSLKSLGTPQSNSHEWSKLMPHVEFILDLPWKEETVQEGDIAKVWQVLDEDHYGLVREKDAICLQVAPRLLNPEAKGTIICLVGAPGVGKTSLAKSIAKALNRKYVRMSLGGVNDEAHIRGHRSTYIGAQPGKILKLMKKCGVRNPLFVIDEIDKLGGMSVQGDPSAAMLEVLDPEQNNSFADHYADCEFDLSKVMFLATANQEDTILPALRDRMDITRLPGYLEVEKVEIAKRHLIPRLMRNLGLTQNNIEVVWEEELIYKIIRGYTNEAGIRNIERALATIIKNIGREYLKSKGEEKPITKFEVTEQKVHEYLGPPRFVKDRARPTMIGEAIGLAWTPVGGDILYVQAEFYDRLGDKKVLDLTGMQGDVMKESAHLALTRLRNILRKTNPELADTLEKNAIHLHIPEGAVHKDGPSAGVAIFSAFYSEATGKLVKQNLAMTGEIDNKANVLPVGGIREKVVAAERAGIKEIMLPKDNERSLYDVPQAVKDKLKFHFIENVDQALRIAFPEPV